MLVTIDDLQTNLMEIEVVGKLTKEDYTTCLLPKVKHMLKEHKKIRLLVNIDSSFAGMEMAAVWEDTHFGFAHRHDFEKVAITGEAAWAKWAASLASVLVDADVKYFKSSQISHAKAWLNTSDMDL